jgi:hypothetical protein
VYQTDEVADISDFLNDSKGNQKSKQQRSFESMIHEADLLVLMQ